MAMSFKSFHSLAFPFFSSPAPIDSFSFALSLISQYFLFVFCEPAYYILLLHSLSFDPFLPFSVIDGESSECFDIYSFTNTTHPMQDKSMSVSSTLPASALDANEIYLEPFLRAFCLGVGSGVILEVAHVAFKLANVAESLPTTVAPETLFSIIRSEPGIWEQFAPLFYADHAMAVLAWIGFYIIDVLAIKAILDKYNDDPKTANHALRHLVTLPKKMLPVRLGFVQKLVLKILGRDRFMSPGTVNSISTTALHESSVESDKRSTTMPDDSTSAFNIVPSNVTTLPPPPTTTKGAAPTIKNKSGSSTTSPDAKAYPGLERPGVGQRSKDLSPGQLNPDVKSFLRRRRELKQRSSYLTNQWYAAALSENLKADEPLGVDILGRRVLLFRDSTTGKVSCMDDACPHRGAPLSQGWMSVIEGHDCVVSRHLYAIELHVLELLLCCSDSTATHLS